MEWDTERVDVVVFPLTIHITSAKAMLKSSVEVGSQNISAYKMGPYTGEISAEQVKDFELRWTIVGHSERRKMFGETNEVVAQKVKQAQDSGLHSIVCIGEMLEQREAGTTNDVLKTQLDAFLPSVSDWNRIVIAYEPVWAIGTGKVATPEMAQETHAYIR